MKKVKIFEDSSEMVLEEYVNQFLAEHPDSVTDIKFTTMPRSYCPCYAAMIIYDTGLDTIHIEGGESN